MKNVVDRVMVDSFENVEYSSFSRRMLASVIDTVLSAIVIAPALGVVYRIMGIQRPENAPVSPEMIKRLSPEELHELLSYMMTSAVVQTVVLAVVVMLFWVYRSATPGKIILKMKIVDAKSGGQPTKMQFMVRFVSVVFLFLGAFWIYYDKRNQGLHDKVARTVVINTG